MTEQEALDQASGQMGLEPGAQTPLGLGRKLLRQTLYSRGWLYRGQEHAPRPQARALSFLCPAAPRQTWIHVYDVRAAYLAMAGNCMLGCGPAVAAEKPQLAFSQDRSGLYHAFSLHVPAHTQQIVPAHGPGWFVHSVLRQVESAGGEVGIDAGWLFPERHRAMRPWAEVLYAAREEAAPPVAAVLKRAANMTIGGLATRRDDQPIRWWYQPQWRAEIISQHAAKMARMVMRWQQAGAHILGVYDDAIAIGSALADGLAACPEPAEIRAAPGKLRLQRSIIASSAGPAWEALATERVVGKWFTLLAACDSRGAA